MVTSFAHGGRSSARGAILAGPAAQLLDVVGESVIVADPTGSILFWNKAAESLYDWLTADVAGRNVVELARSESVGAQVAEIMGRMHAGEAWEGEIEVRRGDGSTTIVAVRHTPVLGDDGELVAIVGVSRDVTDMREMEGALAADRSRLAALVGVSDDLFIVADADGYIRSIDGSVQSLARVERAVLVGRSVFELIQPGDRERAHAMWAQRLSTTAPMPAEDYWIQRSDGAWLCSSVRVTNLLDDPAVGGIVVAGREVTERARMESARAAISATNSALVHSTSESDLFKEICRVVADDRTYHLAWIGLADADHPLGMRMVAIGGAAAYFDALEHLEGTDVYRGPVARALETHEVSVIQDVAALPENVPWRHLALDHGYRSMIAVPLHFSEDNFGVLAIYAEVPDAFTEDAVAVLTELASDLVYGIDALRTRAQGSTFRARFEAGLEAVVRAVATAAELRDPYTAGHQRRVAELVSAIATDLGIEPGLTTGIVAAASIHDIGKLAVPAEILSRPGRLSDTEFALIKEHAQAGCDIIAGIDFPWPVAEMILQHHERLDGSGYPNGLCGEEICVGARILAVADVVEAMQAHRPYRPGLGVAAALHEIDTGRATRFDPDVVDACTHLFRDRSFAFTV